MKTEVKIALIGGAVTIIAAVLPIVLGWYAPGKPSNESSALPSQTAPQSVGTASVPSSNHKTVTESEQAEASSRLQALATIIRNRDVDAAKASPLFQRFVKEHYGKELREVSRRELPAFWVEMAKSLAKERRATQEVPVK